jgi:hypothetical protein
VVQDHTAVLSSGMSSNDLLRKYMVDLLIDLEEKEKLPSTQGQGQLAFALTYSFTTFSACGPRLPCTTLN